MAHRLKLAKRIDHEAADKTEEQVRSFFEQDRMKQKHVIAGGSREEIGGICRRNRRQKKS
jgi:hypothetical protein